MALLATFEPRHSTARRAKSSDGAPFFTDIGFRRARSTEPALRAYFANRTNLWNALRASQGR